MQMCQLKYKDVYDIEYDTSHDVGKLCEKESERAMKIILSRNKDNINQSYKK